jgi:hypothetical protein
MSPQIKLLPSARGTLDDNGAHWRSSFHGWAAKIETEQGLREEKRRSRETR